MSSEDDFGDLFGEAVEPIKKTERIILEKQKADEQTIKTRRKAASEQEALVEDPLAGEPVELLEPFALLDFKRPGVQHGVYKNLRLGKYALDARLDLHGMTVDQSRKAVYNFVKDCIKHDVRSALITHGKSEGRSTPAMLKSCLAFWLPQIDDVLAFHTAQKHHGGFGATYVLFRKSAQKKRETRKNLRGQ